MMITWNADILTHVGTERNFEGAYEAAKYYQRNLRMYTEMNRLDIIPTFKINLYLGTSKNIWLSILLRCYYFFFCNYHVPLGTKYLSTNWLNGR